MKSLLTETHVAMYMMQCEQIYRLDTGVKTIKDFVRLVDKLSLDFIDDNGDEDEENENSTDKANSFKGDMLEIFAEIFFDCFQFDPMVGITGYTPVPLTEDFGVDAIGLNVVGERSAIQCKFRNDPSAAITYADMSKTYVAAQKRHGLSMNADDTLFLFTTCLNVTKACKQVFGSQLRVIDRNIISIRVDNNETFWQEAEQRIVATINKLHGQD